MPTVNDTLSIPAPPLHSPSPSPSPASSPSSELKVSAAGVSTPSIVQPPPIRLGSGTRIIVPNAFWNDYLGTSTNAPTLQFWQRNNPPAAPLAPNLLSVGVNDFLTTGFGLAADTGVVRMDDPDKGAVTSLKFSPHLSRDGGKGGYLNGQKLFIFCDTGSYTPPSNGRDGDFQGFVSSSVAVDVGMNAANRRTLSIEDGMGEWSDDSGRMRGFAPLTEGEQSYNLVMQGKGQRYAIWPESSIIPLNHTHAILYSPIVYDNVDMSTGVTTFTYTGATLLAITTQAIGGPRASRLVDKIFYQDEVEWGTIGGLRSWGPSGVGGNDGRVYVFGKVQWGLLIGRVDARHIDNRDSYEYWGGSRWEQGMPPSSSTAYFINGAIMDADIFYSPRHLTFIIVYLTPWADNTFYYRYLDAPNAIYPQSGDYAEALVKYKWSPEKVLYRAPAGPTGHFIYAGAVQLGYFDGDDIANGGYKMLLTWTVPTGQTPGSTSSEYQFNSADVIFA
ncbi:MAG: hypothetical protein M1825_003952 [Sarcosagium campestre]|nr:MAG: hypothetical protein M1825_003952 [Sarcosagium campestre]